MTQDSIEFLEHTGDIGLHVRAKTLAQLFCSSAIGMFQLICPDCTINHSLERSIVLESENLQELFVSWLSELNFLFCTDLELFSKFDIEQINENELRARVYGEKIDQNIHHIHSEIKAVTYHKLFVGQNSEAWEARVIFDI